MRIAAALAALLALTPAASADQTFAQAFLQKYASYQKAIKDGQSDLTKASPKVTLPEAVVDGFDRKLERILKKAKCEEAESASANRQPSCEKATPDSIEEATDSLNELADGWKEAVAKDAGKTLTELFQAQINALKSQVAAAKSLSSDDKNKLDAEISDFQSSLTDPAKMKAALGANVKNPQTYAQYTRDYQKVAADIQAKIALLGANGGADNIGSFIADFAGQMNKLEKSIKGSALSLAYQGQYLEQINNIALNKKTCATVGDVVFGSAASSSDAWAAVSKAATAKSGAATAKSRSTGAPCQLKAEQIEAASQALTQISEAFAAAVKGGQDKQTVYQLYESELNALQTEVSTTTLNASVKTKFQTRLNTMISNFKKGTQAATTATTMRTITSGATRVVQQQAADISPQDAQNEIAQFIKDWAAALFLQKNGGGSNDVQAFSSQITSLEKSIDNSKLDGPFKKALVAQAEAAKETACDPNAAEGKNGKKAAQGLAVGMTGAAGLTAATCPRATQDSIADGVAALQQVEAAFQAAQKTDGTKTLSALYTTLLAPLKLALDGSKVDATNKKALATSITDFEAELTYTDNADDSKKGAAPLMIDGKKVKPLTPDQAQTEFQDIQKNVNAALELTLHPNGDVQAAQPQPQN